MQNLDQICARYGFKFAEEISKDDAKKAEKLITDALSVLQEQGLYAFVLFCRSRSEAKKLENLTKELLKELDLIKNSNSKVKEKENINMKDSAKSSDDLLDKIREDILADIDKLMFAVSVLEKSLIYARFHTKAIKESRGESS